MFKKSFITEKLAKEKQSTQSQNLVDECFAIFAYPDSYWDFANFAVKGF